MRELGVLQRPALYVLPSFAPCEIQKRFRQELFYNGQASRTNTWPGVHSWSTLARIVSTQYSLVARLQADAADSDWKRFYTLYERPILAFAAARSLNHAECCDVLQEIMVKMLRGGFSRFDPEKGTFTGFLFHVARGCTVDAIRRRTLWQARHVPILDAALECGSPVVERLASLSEGPADSAERQSQIVLIHIVLEFLTDRKCFQPKTVALFKAVTFEQKDPADAAASFGTSVGNVYEAKRVVLAKLRAMLRALDEGFDLDQALTR